MINFNLKSFWITMKSSILIVAIFCLQCSAIPCEHSEQDVVIKQTFVKQTITISQSSARSSSGSAPRIGSSGAPRLVELPSTSRMSQSTPRTSQGAPRLLPAPESSIRPPVIPSSSRTSPWPGGSSSTSRFVELPSSTKVSQSKPRTTQSTPRGTIGLPLETSDRRSTKGGGSTTTIRQPTTTKRGTTGLNTETRVSSYGESSYQYDVFGHDSMRKLAKRESEAAETTEGKKLIGLIEQLLHLDYKLLRLVHERTAVLHLEVIRFGFKQVLSLAPDERAYLEESQPFSKFPDQWTLELESRMPFADCNLYETLIKSISKARKIKNSAAIEKLLNDAIANVQRNQPRVQDSFEDDKLPKYLGESKSQTKATIIDGLRTQSSVSMSSLRPSTTSYTTRARTSTVAPSNMELARQPTTGHSTRTRTSMSTATSSNMELARRPTTGYSTRTRTSRRTTTVSMTKNPLVKYDSSVHQTVGELGEDNPYETTSGITDVMSSPEIEEKIRSALRDMMKVGSHDGPSLDEFGSIADGIWEACGGEKIEKKAMRQTDASFESLASYQNDLPNKLSDLLQSESSSTVSVSEVPNRSSTTRTTTGGSRTTTGGGRTTTGGGRTTTGGGRTTTGGRKSTTTKHATKKPRGESKMSTIGE